MQLKQQNRSIYCKIGTSRKHQNPIVEERGLVLLKTTFFHTIIVLIKMYPNVAIRNTQMTDRGSPVRMKSATPR